MDCKNATVEDAMTMMIAKFNKYAAGRDQDKDTMNYDELCDMAPKEFPSLCASSNKQEILKGIVGKMDANNDKKVDFQEYMSFCACVAIALRECLKK